MKDKWLSLVLRITNRIYAKKQDIVKQKGINLFIAIFALIFWEITLAIISLPLYLTTKSSTVIASSGEKDKYTKISFDYNIRRILTLTGVGLLFLIWMIKLFSLILIPQFYGSLQLYSVSELKSVEQLEEATSIFQIEEAEIDEEIEVPALTDIQKAESDSYVFYGEGEAGLEVVLLLSDEQTIFYSDQIEEDGKWEIRHSQESLKLQEGTQPVTFFGYDADSGKRSELAKEHVFEVSTTWIEKISRNIDNFINWIIIGFLLIGVFLTFITI